MTKDRIRRFFQKLNHPPGWVAVLTYATAFVICPLTLATVLLGQGGGMFTTIAYVISSVSFIYMTMLTVAAIQRFRRKVLNVADKYSFTRKLHKNYEFRTLVFGAIAFLFNIGYTVFLVVMAFIADSLFYGTLAVYYILLSTSRGGLLIDARKSERKYKDDPWRLQKEKIGMYRYCGMMMVGLTLALAVSVVEMVSKGEGFRVPQGAIYAFAAFTLYRVAMTMYNFIKSTRYDDLTVRAVRHINMAAALVSLLSLQTALFAAFPPKFDAALWNGITGTVVCMSIVTLGTYMLAFASKAKKRILQGRVCVERAKAEQNEAYSAGYNRADYSEEYGAETVTVTDVYRDEN